QTRMFFEMIRNNDMAYRCPSRVALLLATTASILLTAASARAEGPTTADCLSANESSIKLRGEHKLRDARTQALICSASSCPTDVRNACTRRVAEVTAAIPTVTFEAKDAAGNDLTVVRVTMDGH